MVELKSFSEKLMQFYRELELVFTSYQQATGITCPVECGKCCLYPEIEASPLEMLPLALHLFAEGKAEAYLDRLENETSICVMFQGDENKGRCSAYAYRPSVCRMFGVAGVLDKRGEVSLSICKHLKDHKAATPELLLNQLVKIPVIQDWTRRLMSIDPKLVNEKLPINQALKQSLEKVLLLSQFQ